MLKILQVMLGTLLLVPATVDAGMDHVAHRGSVAHEEVVDGVKVTFRLTDIVDELTSKGITVPKGIKETHHLGAEFRDARSGTLLSNGNVRVKIQVPGKPVESKVLTGMDGHFGVDLELPQPGKYGIMCRFTLADGKSRQVKFWYVVN